MERPRPPVGPPVGTSVPRVDGVAKVTGRALYLDDLDATGAWHGATVRSQVAHGVLEAIELDPAFDGSAVTVVTAADIWGKNAIALIEDDQPALVPIGGRVMHRDEPLALVAAPTRELAFAAARAVRPKIAPLPAVFDVDAALAGPPHLYGATNVFKQFVIRKGHAADAELDAAFAAAAHVLEGSYATSPQEQMYIEPQAMMAEWHGARCHIVGSMQCPYYVHKAMKVLLACDADQVVVTQSVTGGAFGGKEEYPSMLAAHVALLAHKAGRAVKMVYDRDEDIAATTKRHPCRTRHRMAIDARGELLALDIDVVMDGGAYLTLSPVVLSRGVLHAAGPYRCPIVRVRGRVVATNHPPHGAFRGFGAPQTTFAYERQIQKLARLRGEDPLALRRRLALRLGDTTSTGQRLEHSVGSDEVIGAIEAVAGAVPARTGVNAAGAPVRRGRGVCFYFHGAGFTGSGEQRLAGRAEVAAVGDRFEVRSSSSDMGQGSITIFTQIAAAALGVDASQVAVIDPSTAQVPDSGPTVASRTAMVVGGLVERAARAVRARLEAWGAERGLTGPLIELARAHAEATGGELAELASYEPPPGIQWDDATYTGSAYPVYGWAACLVDVEV
ncbi:MAG TPA: xanthine dehydrogenase family protein, partial [Kofleriaceae bacterium]|nr:xanthine dehydrogenase family protein [Kofleriaceae bacterium]